MWTEEDQAQLLAIARKSIENGLQSGKPLVPETETASNPLQAIRASFVTLTLNQNLRGCIGSLEAHRPLINDVAANAYSSAFKDPRFPPVSAEELEKITVEISILSPMEPMQANDEQDLLAQLQPSIDGLLIDDGRHRATFLPQVWSQLPEPALFLNHLKRKAGMPLESWPDTMQCYRYHCDKFREQTA
ncbi:AMMECR1 domain-containing protein [Elysia marginata]|uniref:AMMECR1 domain-containing protein n=1 Tax=Elysia marginata TaxID=1093978 RepID=A0AAV4ESF1_9GAST|nr:AMMECR1 domain-containing protein [Elysia marginata]